MQLTSCPSCDGKGFWSIDRAPNGRITCFVCGGAREIPLSLADEIAILTRGAKPDEVKPAQPVLFDESDWK